MKTLFVTFILICTSYAQSLQLLQTNPENYATADTSLHQISINFNAPVDTNNLKERIRLLSSYTTLINYNYAVEANDVFIYPRKQFKEGESINVIVTSNLQGSAEETFDGFYWEFAPSGRLNFA